MPRQCPHPRRQGRKGRERWTSPLCPPVSQVPSGGPHSVGLFRSSQWQAWSLCQGKNMLAEGRFRHRRRDASMFELLIHVFKWVGKNNIGKWGTGHMWWQITPSGNHLMKSSSASASSGKGMGCRSWARPGLQSSYSQLEGKRGSQY